MSINNKLLILTIITLKNYFKFSMVCVDVRDNNLRIRVMNLLFFNIFQFNKKINRVYEEVKLLTSKI